MYPNYPQQPGYPNYPPNNQYGQPPNQGPSYGFNDGNGMAYPGGGQNPYGNNNPQYPSGNQSGFPVAGFDQPGSGYPGYGGGGYPPSNPSYPPSNNYPPSGGSYLPDHIASNPNFQPSGPYGGYPPQQGNNQYPGGHNQYPSNQYPPQQPNSGLYPNLSGAGAIPPPQSYVPPNNQPYGGGAPGPYGGAPQNYQQAPPRNPVLRPYQPFNASDDAARIRKAMKGFGTDETALIDILCKRTSDQRQEIALTYKASYGKELLKSLKEELSGNTELVFKALMLTPAQLDAHDLQDALDGIGTNEAALIDICCTKTNAEMNAMKMAYRQMYGRDLERDVGGDVSGYFRRFLVSLITAHRSEAPPNPQRAAQLAAELHSAGEKRMGTNEMEFNRVFCAESFPQLRLVFEEYQRKTGHDIEKAVKGEMSGDIERAYLAVMRIARNPAQYWAKRLHETMQGAGTHDRSLVRIMVSRSEIDMMDIKLEFQRMFGKNLESFIRADCSGHYERALLCLAGDPSWR